MASAKGTNGKMEDTKDKKKEDKKEGCLEWWGFGGLEWWGFVRVDSYPRLLGVVFALPFAVIWYVRVFQWVYGWEYWLCDLLSLCLLLVPFYGAAFLAGADVWPWWLPRLTVSVIGCYASAYVGWVAAGVESRLFPVPFALDLLGLQSLSVWIRCGCIFTALVCLVLLLRRMRWMMYGRWEFLARVAPGTRCWFPTLAAPKGKPWWLQSPEPPRRVVFELSQPFDPEADQPTLRLSVSRLQPTTTAGPTEEDDFAVCGNAATRGKPRGWTFEYDSTTSVWRLTAAEDVLDPIRLSRPHQRAGTQHLPVEISFDHLILQLRSDQLP